MGAERTFRLGDHCCVLFRWQPHVTRSKDKTVRIWRVADWKTERVLEGHSDWVWSVAFRPGDAYAVSGSLWRLIVLRREHKMRLSIHTDPGYEDVGRPALPKVSGSGEQIQGR